MQTDNYTVRSYHHLPTHDHDIESNLPLCETVSIVAYI